MLQPFSRTCWEEPYFCCGFILGLGSGQFIFLFVSLSVLIKRKKKDVYGFHLGFFFIFFLNACQLGSSSGGCCRMKQDAPEPLWRGGGTGGTVGNAVDGFPLLSWGQQAQSSQSWGHGERTL